MHIGVTRHTSIYRSPLKKGWLRKELENVPPPLGNRVRKHTTAKTKPQAYLSSPTGVISSLAGISSPPLKKVANKPQAKHRTLPLSPPIPSSREVPNDSKVAVLLPNKAWAIRPPSSRPQGKRFNEVTTMPAHVNYSCFNILPRKNSLMWQAESILYGNK